MSQCVAQEDAREAADHARHVGRCSGFDPPGCLSYVVQAYFREIVRARARELSVTRAFSLDLGRRHANDRCRAISCNSAWHFGPGSLQPVCPFACGALAHQTRARNRRHRAKLVRVSRRSTASAVTPCTDRRTFVGGTERALQSHAAVVQGNRRPNEAGIAAANQKPKRPAVRDRSHGE